MKVCGLINRPNEINITLLAGEGFQLPELIDAYSVIAQKGKILLTCHSYILQDKTMLLISHINKDEIYGENIKQ